MKALWVKTVFLGVLLVLYLIAAVPMVTQPTKTVDYSPNAFVTWVVVTVGAALLAALAAQLGVTLTSSGQGFTDKLANRHFQLTSLGTGERRQKVAAWFNVIALVATGVTLLVIGIMFVRLAADPSLIAVANGAKKLKNAPDFIETQAKSIVTFAIAAAGLGTALGK